MSPTSPPNPKAGFTLVEILIATTILVVVVGMATQMLVSTGRASFITDERLDINADVRQLTNEIIADGQAADRFYIYASYDASVYAPDENGNYGAARLGDGKTGDLMLLVYEGSESSEEDGYPITRIVGIYRDSTQDNPTQAPVRRFAVENVDSDDAYLAPEALIPKIEDTANHSTIVELAEGLANGSLFYNYKDTSVMLNAKIVHGNAAKEITDTYNLTIRPRGGFN